MSMTSVIENFDNAYKKLKGVCGTLEDENKLLKKQLEAVNNSSMEACADYERLVDKYNNETQNYQSIISDLEAQVKESKDYWFKKGYDEAEQTYKVDKEYLDEKEKEIERLENLTEINEIKEEVEKLKERIKKDKLRYDVETYKLKEEIEELKKKDEEALKMSMELTNKFETQIEELMNERDKLKEECDRLKVIEKNWDEVVDEFDCGWDTGTDAIYDIQEWRDKWNEWDDNELMEFDAWIENIQDDGKEVVDRDGIELLVFFTGIMENKIKEKCGIDSKEHIGYEGGEIYMKDSIRSAYNCKDYLHDLLTEMNKLGLVGEDVNDLRALNKGLNTKLKIMEDLYIKKQKAAMIVEEALKKNTREIMYAIESA